MCSCSIRRNPASEGIFFMGFLEFQEGICSFISWEDFRSIRLVRTFLCICFTDLSLSLSLSSTKDWMKSYICRTSTKWTPQLYIPSNQTIVFLRLLFASDSSKGTYWDPNILRKLLVQSSEGTFWKDSFLGDFAKMFPSQISSEIPCRCSYVLHKMGWMTSSPD